jgi:hypothetical protein
VRLNSRLTCRNGVAFRQQEQFSLRNSKFRGATIQADHNLGEYPHDGLINIFQSEKMDAHLRAEFPLVDLIHTTCKPCRPDSPLRTDLFMERISGGSARQPRRGSASEKSLAENYSEAPRMSVLRVTLPSLN